jgi:hypothetical protein
VIVQMVRVWLKVSFIFDKHVDVGCLPRHPIAIHVQCRDIVVAASGLQTTSIDNQAMSAISEQFGWWHLALAVDRPGEGGVFVAQYWNSELRALYRMHANIHRHAKP